MSNNIEVKNLFNLHSLDFEKVGDQTIITIKLWTLERDSGESCIASFTSSVSSESDLAAETKKLLISGYEHEIDECLYSNNQQVKNPHWCPVHQKEFGILCRECLT